MDFLITPLKDLVTEKGRFLLQDHRTLSFLCRQVLIQEGKAILDLDDVLVIEGARVILRVLPKNNKIDLCPSFIKPELDILPPPLQVVGYKRTKVFLKVTDKYYRKGVPVGLN